MNPARREVLQVFGLALLLLPPCLAAWFFAAPAIGWLPSRLAAPAIAAAAGPVTSIESSARQVIYAVRVEGTYRPGGSPQVEARVEVPSATYTFGIAIFLALALASKAWRQPARLALGIAILLPLPVVGIAFDALRQLGAAPQLAELLAWRPGMREAIALGYQVGSLLLPTLAPIAAWLALFWLPATGKPSPAPRIPA
jgi:hypothetical protein